MLKRHTLCFLDEQGIRAMWANLETAFPDRETVQQLYRRFSGIPVIVRRERDIAELVPIGLSFPVLCSGTRCRAASGAPLETAGVRAITPEEIFKLGLQGKTELTSLLRAVGKLADRAHVRPGVFGSGALEIVTGLAYLHKNSDLDLVVYPEAGADIAGFTHGLESLQSGTVRTVDAEVSLGAGYYGKLKEMAAEPKSILVKGGQTPVLMAYREVQELLHQTGL